MRYKKVRFEYYQVVFRKSSDSKRQRDRLFDLVQWVNKANRSKTLLDRTFDFYTEKARLEEAYYSSFSYYFLHFVRLGDNIPSKSKLTEKVKPIELEDDEYIGNEVSALYDETHHILMLQRNRASLGPSGIEYYLNVLWDSDDETIFLRPISPKGMFEQTLNANEFRKIHMRFADIDTSKIEDNAKTSPMVQFVKNFTKYSGVTGEVVISAGRGKGRSLDSETMIETINDIIANQETGLIKKAEVHYKITDDTATEVVDLFAKRAHDFHSFPMEKRTTLSHTSIAEEMLGIYHSKNKKTQILKYLAEE